MSYPRSAPRVPSNSAAWESREDSAGGAAFSSQAQELSSFYTHSIQTYKYLRVDTFELSPYNLHNMHNVRALGQTPGWGYLVWAVGSSLTEHATNKRGG